MNTTYSTKMLSTQLLTTSETLLEACQRLFLSTLPRVSKIFFKPVVRFRLYKYTVVKNRGIWL